MEMLSSMRLDEVTKEESGIRGERTELGISTEGSLESMAK